MQLQANYSVKKTGEKGLQGLWQGLLINIGVVVLSALSTFFLDKEMIGQILREGGLDPLVVGIGVMVCAAIAKMLDNLRKQLRS